MNDLRKQVILEKLAALQSENPLLRRAKELKAYHGSPNIPSSVLHGGSYDISKPSKAPSLYQKGERLLNPQTTQERHAKYLKGRKAKFDKGTKVKRERRERNISARLERQKFKEKTKDLPKWVKKRTEKHDGS